MSNFTLLTSTDYRRMPWKNRGGSTLELLRHPHPDDPERFLYRLSIASVKKAGPFSCFPGVERYLMLLEGQGMRLKLGDGREVCLDKSFEPFRFDGELEVDCELIDGPIRDFNLMFDRERYEAELEIVSLDSWETLTVPEADCLLLYVLAGKPLVQVEETPFHLSPERLLQVENAPAVTLTSMSIVKVELVLMRLTARV